MQFKVIDVVTNRKPTCGILLVNRTVFQLSRITNEIIVFDKGVRLVNALVIGNRCEYRHKSYTAEN